MGTSYSIFEWFFYLFFMFIFLIAILCNSIILNIIIKKQFNTTTYKLIANQVVSDIAFSVLALSRNFFCSLYIISHSDYLLTFCGIIISINDSTVYVSVFSMMITAYERYRKLYSPSSRNLNTKLFIITIWLTAIWISLFNNINRQNIILFNEKVLFSCKITFKSKLKFFLKRYNYGITFALSAIIPLIITAYYYYKVIVKIRERKVVGTSTITDKKKKLQKNKRKTVEMLLAIVIWYFLITTPYYTFIFVEVFVKNLDTSSDCNSEKQFPIHKFFVLGFFYLGSLCVNPFIICWYNCDFKEEVVRIFNLQKFIKTRNPAEITLETTST